ncbi:MAG: Asp-tRNA(Asn)/Glu-tRNA(Gln) amidotransferase subunit GatA, partial [Dinghuibacter sp.]|nr:Asp-tRNA(Asn)/Glu-tRNA(Gln) amidotransferase subunit GatA [Dinghuibacter sp.]
VVLRLLNEGAIIIGHQNCDEFAMGSSNENSCFGPVKNAADETRVPGGSSGGSAVAVQAGLCMLSLGSDTGGSVRQPADFCGIVGLKPSYGRVSRYGLIAYASSFDQVGILAANVPDAALALEVIAGTDGLDSTLYPEPVPEYSTLATETQPPLRIGYFTEALNHPSLDKEIAAAIKQQLEQLKEQGHTVTELSFSLLNYLVPTYYILTMAEAASNLSRYDGVRYGLRVEEPEQDLISFYKNNRSKGFGAEVKRRIMLGNFVLSAGYYDAYYNKAQQVRRKLHNLASELFTRCDVLLMPNSPVPAFKAGEKSDDPLEMYLADIYTVFANLAALPAISLPLYHHSNGMPFGLQVLAAQHNDAGLLRFANSIARR